MYLEIHQSAQAQTAKHEISPGTCLGSNFEKFARSTPVPDLMDPIATAADFIVDVVATYAVPTIAIGTCHALWIECVENGRETFSQ
jgi:hypothetical protein